ncbi:hypothetical protein [Mesorhizobium sp.]|uniref:hypothetical protein n=1 Tax=Mesorhizobium sp. TaxID=1871066 RepID=UPI000FE8290A|nr:hypothetical protein [Mesorhizobium sp.]RWO20481.1 MAG: hypothetical protein EOS09_26955 [Mesorhizobium sp.]
MVLDTRAKQVADEHHGVVAIGVGFDSAFFLHQFVGRRKGRVLALEWDATTRMIGSSNAAQTAISGRTPADRGITRSAWSAAPTAGSGRHRGSLLTTSTGRPAMTISSLSAAAQAVMPVSSFARGRKYYDGVL